MGLASETLQADNADMLPMFMPAELDPISRDTATITTQIRDLYSNIVKDKGKSGDEYIIQGTIYNTRDAY